MFSFLGKRLAQMLVTFLLFQAATYFLIDAQPGDVADLLTNNPEIPASQREVIRSQLGLDKPPATKPAQKAMMEAVTKSTMVRGSLSAMISVTGRG